MPTPDARSASSGSVYFGQVVDSEIKVWEPNSYLCTAWREIFHENRRMLSLAILNARSDMRNSFPMRRLRIFRQKQITCVCGFA